MGAQFSAGENRRRINKVNNTQRRMDHACSGVGVAVFLWTLRSLRVGVIRTTEGTEIEAQANLDALKMRPILVLP